MPQRRSARGRRQSSSSDSSETENQPPRRGRVERVVESDSSEDTIPRKKIQSAQNKPQAPQIARSRRRRANEEPTTSGEHNTLRENNSFDN